MPISKEHRRAILDTRLSTSRILKANSFDTTIDFLLGEVDSLTMQLRLRVAADDHYQSLLKLEDALASVGYGPRVSAVG